jgi:hypothetical protein
MTDYKGGLRKQATLKVAFFLKSLQNKDVRLKLDQLLEMNKKRTTRCNNGVSL